MFKKPFWDDLGFMTWHIILLVAIKMIVFFNSKIL